MDSDRYKCFILKFNKIGIFFLHISLHIHCNKNKIIANQFYFTSYWAIIFWPDYHYRSTSENFSPDVYNSNLALKISEVIFEKNLLPSIIIITQKKTTFNSSISSKIYVLVHIFSLYLQPNLLLVISTYLLATVVLIGFNVVALLCVCVFLLNTQQRRLIVS